MMMTIELEINGMSCEHCVQTVTKALLGVAGVTEAVVSLAEKRATVTAGEEVKVGDLVAAVEEAGYEAKAVLTPGPFPSADLGRGEKGNLTPGPSPDDGRGEKGNGN